MRLAKKPVVKRIRPPRKTKMKAFKSLSLEADCETQKSAENSTHKISLQNQYDLLKIAINCMFLLNGGAAIALINNDIIKHFFSVFIFSAGAAISIALYIYVAFTSAVENMRNNESTVRHTLTIYSPIVIFMSGLIYTLLRNFQ